MGMSRCGVLGFLRGGGDGVETDEGEEDDAGAAEDAAPAVAEDAFVAGRAGGDQVRHVVGAVDELPAEAMKSMTMPTLMKTMMALSVGRLLGALDEESGDQEQDDQSRER